jgi:hypothetical protein
LPYVVVQIAQVAHEAIHGGAREDLRRRRRAAERFPERFRGEA